MEKKFSIKKALIFAAQALINHFFLFYGILLFGFFVFCMLLLYGLFLAPQFFSGFIKWVVAVEFGNAPHGYEPANKAFWQSWNLLSQGTTYNIYLIAILASIVMLWFLISIFLNLGLIKIILNIYDRKPIHFSLLFSQYRLILRGFFATLLYYLIVLIGFILFIVPGIIFLIRFGFYLYYIVDTDCSIIESFKKSWHLSSHATPKLLATYGVLGLISMFILKGFSLAWLIDDLVFVYFYRVLRNQHGERNGRNGKVRSIQS